MYNQSPAVQYSEQNSIIPWETIDGSQGYFRWLKNKDDKTQGQKHIHG